MSAAATTPVSPTDQADRLEATRTQLALATKASSPIASAKPSSTWAAQDNLDVRLGGIYALEWLTTSSPDNRRTVARILIAYVGQHAVWTAGPAQRGRINGPPPTSEDQGSSIDESRYLY